VGEVVQRWAKHRADLARQREAVERGRARGALEQNEPVVAERHEREAEHQTCIARAMERLIEFDRARNGGQPSQA